MRMSFLLLVALALAGAAQAQPSTVLPDIIVTAPRVLPRALEETVELPVYTNPQSLALPARRAASNAAWAFGLASHLAGRPAYAAQVLMEMEYLSVEIVKNPSHWEASGEVDDLFTQAKQEWRAAIGIPEATPTQLAIDGLYLAMRALGERAAPEALLDLPTGIFSLGPEETFRRLNALGYLHNTNVVAVAVSRSLRRGRKGG
jgi:hypothetical protein